MFVNIRLPKGPPNIPPMVRSQSGQNLGDFCKMSSQIRAKIGGLEEDLGRESGHFPPQAPGWGGKWAKMGEKSNILARSLPLQGFWAKNVASNPGQTAREVSGPNWYPREETFGGIFGGPTDAMISGRAFERSV